MSGYLPALISTPLACPRCGRYLNCTLPIGSSVEEKTTLRKESCECGQIAIGRWYTPQAIDVGTFRRDEVYAEVRAIREREQA